MTNGGSVNFCLRESSIKVRQPLTMCCHFKVEFVDTLPYLSYPGTLCLPQGPGVAKTLYYTCMQHHLLSEDLEIFDTTHIVIL